MIFAIFRLSTDMFCAKRSSETHSLVARKLSPQKKETGGAGGNHDFLFASWLIMNFQISTPSKSFAKNIATSLLTESRG